MRCWISKGITPGAETNYRWLSTYCCWVLKICDLRGDACISFLRLKSFLAETILTTLREGDFLLFCVSITRIKFWVGTGYFLSMLTSSATCNEDWLWTLLIGDSCWLSKKERKCYGFLCLGGNEQCVDPTTLLRSSLGILGWSSGDTCPSALLPDRGC